jgi:hypothetical protein
MSAEWGKKEEEVERRERQRKREKVRKRGRGEAPQMRSVAALEIEAKERGEAHSRRAHLLERIYRRLMGKKRGNATRGCILRDCKHGAASATRAGGGWNATLKGSQRQC